MSETKNRKFGVIGTLYITSIGTTITHTEKMWIYQNELLAHRFTNDTFSRDIIEDNEQLMWD